MLPVLDEAGFRFCEPAWFCGARRSSLVAMRWRRQLTRTCHLLGFGCLDLQPCCRASSNGDLFRLRPEKILSLRFSDELEYVLSWLHTSSRWPSDWRALQPFCFSHTVRIFCTHAGSPTPCADGCYFPCTWQAAYRNRSIMRRLNARGLQQRRLPVICVCALSP